MCLSNVGDSGFVSLTSFYRKKGQTIRPELRCSSYFAGAVIGHIANAQSNVLLCSVVTMEMT